ncbi:MAG: hypothetical protein N3A54_00940 [Patescibacteria group bacterium]|nr:hypothetical protein [Patescibacteria group bacterium]
MSSGEVEGVASVAFPLVRRVFADIFAEKIVSVQPMNAPYGLIFYLDFVYSSNDASKKMGMYNQESVYGGNVKGAEIINGVDVDSNSTGFYDLRNGYSSPYKTNTGLAFATGSDPADNQIAVREWETGSNSAMLGTNIGTMGYAYHVEWDPQILKDGSNYYRLYAVQLPVADWNRLNLNNTMGINVVLKTDGTETGAKVVHRLTKLDKTNRTILLVMKASNSGSLIDNAGSNPTCDIHFVINDAWGAGSTLGTIVGEDWYFEGPANKSSEYGVTGTFQSFPELDMKINSTHISAITKKLKAKWTPELAQDLSAFHNVDAEVELTGILSDHIELEIDREILNDLLKGATAGKRYWNRHPGVFVDSITGAPLGSPPDFTGPVDKWNETLMIVLNDLSATIHRKTLLGPANFIVCGPEVAVILESSNAYLASVEPDDAKGVAGVRREGSISKKWDVYVDPYFPRNVILIGRQGKQFLETGYVYAPYVPLQVSATIPDPEDFTPRKAVMQRYGKKMVRSDCYGLVIVQNVVF